jgi:hypothetical protein
MLPRIGVSQSIPEIEDHIKYSLETFQRFQDSGIIESKQKCRKCDSYDSLGKENIRLTQYLLNTLPLVPETLTDSVSDLYSSKSVASMTVVTSADKKLRQWNWVPWVKNSIPENFQIIEYRTIKGVRTTIPPYLPYESSRYNPDNPRFDTIYIIHSKKGVTYYLPLQSYKFDSQTSAQKISAISISDTGIVFNCKLFPVRGNLAEEIWNYGVRNDTSDGYRNNRMIVINNSNMIMVPDYNLRDKMKLRWITYEFDGEHFVYKGITK